MKLSSAATIATKARTALVDKIVDRCLAQAGEVDAAIARLDALEHDVRALEAIDSGASAGTANSDFAYFPPHYMQRMD